MIGYADDILIYVSGKDTYTLGGLLQPSLDKILDWGKSNGLSFNPSKTNAVLFRSNRKKFVAPKIKLGGVAVELEDSFKYLGVEIYKTLSWIRHINKRANKCK